MLYIYICIFVLPNCYIAWFYFYCDFFFFTYQTIFTGNLDLANPSSKCVGPPRGMPLLAWIFTNYRIQSQDITQGKKI